MFTYKKPTHPHNYLIDKFNFNRFMQYAAATRSTIKIYTRTRHYIGNFKAIDHENPPIIFNSFWISGALIYHKAGYNITTINYDDVLKIEIA